MVKNHRTNTLPILSISSSLAKIVENVQKCAHLHLGEFSSWSLISASPCRLVYQLRSTFSTWPICPPGPCSCDTTERGLTLEKSNVLSMAGNFWAIFFPRLSLEEQSEWKRELGDGLQLSVQQEPCVLLLRCLIYLEWLEAPEASNPWA